MIDNQEMKNQLFEILAKLDTREKVKVFFDDLCTPKEIEYMAQRIEGAKLLMKKESYNQIISKTNISTATLGRINRCIQYGSGGYNDILKKYFEDNGEI